MNVMADDLRLAVREQCREWLGEYSVLDLLATPEKRQIYHDASAYLGFGDSEDADVWPGSPMGMIPDAYRLRCWNLVDIDSPSNPYLLLAQVARYAPEGVYAVAMTDGLRRTMIRKQGSDFVRWVTGFPADDCRLLHRWYDDFVRWALATIPRMKIIEARRATADPTKRGAYYYALHVEFVGPVIGAHRG
jgi:hypothetical protein